ncbi:ribosome silencing factor [Breznakiella homolactica]|uniref:Ribosomal silencing factor RsfS n=1 Tax=Breznakiella homolactica TaxID=2798577 RepID=A0A7T7XRG8_9SPIR|nr:ribosome silencing factor [Breznakiella homolactica]QQO11140.1 ribosome silencing factor [Breznakiella homolactica]
MGDTLRTDDAAFAVELGRLIQDHRGGDVVVMDLRELHMWTDFFVVATVTSSAHLAGLQRHIKDFCVQNSIEIVRRHKKVPAGDEWSLIDLGNIVVHLMTSKARSFYELERLWSGASIVFKGNNPEG